VNGKRIFVVDDEPNLIRSLSFILTKEGFEVSSAENGEDAVRMIPAYRPALVFLDLMIPGKNGYQVCEEIRSMPDLKNIYIIILSAKGGDVDKDKALIAGVNEFMSKPFSPLAVISLVKRIMLNLPETEPVKG
jgi:two-component system, OmpR family, alkaline phosphatase synthesis response regulator PhoP